MPFQVTVEFGASPEILETEPLAAAYKRVDVIPVLCPVTDCPSDSVILPRRDRITDLFEAQFYCTVHNRYFSLATSRLFRLLYTHELEQGLLLRWQLDLPQDHVARTMGVSIPVISQLETAMATEVQHELDRIRRLPTTPAPTTTPPAPRDRAEDRLHLDTTWLGKSDAQQRVMFPTLGNHEPIAMLEHPNDRKETFTHVLTECVSQLDTIPILICSDGTASLPWAVEDLNLPSIVVQHPHSPPYNRALINWRWKDECGCHYRVFIGIPNDFTVMTGPRNHVTGRVMIQRTSCERHQCSCRISLCVEERSCHPLCRECEEKEEMQRHFNASAGLLPFQVFSRGTEFELTVLGPERTPKLGTLPWDDDHHPLARRLRSALFTMIRHVWEAFQGQCITNNLSECSNARHKHRTTTRGRPSHDRAHLRRRFLLKWAVTCCGLKLGRR